MLASLSLFLALRLSGDDPLPTRFDYGTQKKGSKTNFPVFCFHSRRLVGEELGASRSLAAPPAGGASDSATLRSSPRTAAWNAPGRAASGKTMTTSSPRCFVSCWSWS